MARKQVTLDVFEESVLPMLQQKHTDIEKLQKAINDEYFIYEEGEDGKKEAWSSGQKAGWNAPATVRGQAAKSWQDRHPCQQKIRAPLAGGPVWIGTTLASHR